MNHDKLREAAKQFLRAFDFAQADAEDEWLIQPDAGCYECTLHTVPHDKDTGLCGYHALLAAIAAEELLIARDGLASRPSGLSEALPGLPEPMYHAYTLDPMQRDDLFDPDQLRAYGESCRLASRPAAPDALTAGELGMPVIATCQVCLRSLESCDERLCPGKLRSRLQSSPAALPVEGEVQRVASVEGVVIFMRSSTDHPKACICCPGEPSHIFARYLDTPNPTHPAYSKKAVDWMLYESILQHNKNEGRRVRVTVELLPAPPTERSTPAPGKGGE